MGRGDTLTGEQTRTIVLDTTGARWKALFFAGDELLGQGEFDMTPKEIRHIAISVFENTTELVLAPAPGSLPPSAETRHTL